MPAKSKKQQKFFAVVYEYLKGNIKNPSESVRRAAESISKEDARHFAATKHEGLPDKVSEYLSGIKSHGRLKTAAEAYLACRTPVRKMAWLKTPVRIQNRDVVYDFDSLEEAASYLASLGTLTEEEVAQMLSDREGLINGFSIIYGSDKSAEVVFVDPNRKMNSVLRANIVADLINKAKEDADYEDEVKKREEEERRNTEKTMDETLTATSGIIDAVSKLLA